MAELRGDENGRNDVDKNEERRANSIKVSSHEASFRSFFFLSLDSSMRIPWPVVLLFRSSSSCSKRRAATTQHRTRPSTGRSLFQSLLQPSSDRPKLRYTYVWNTQRAQRAAVWLPPFRSPRLCNYDFIFMDINYTGCLAVSLYGILIQGCRHNGNPRFGFTAHLPGGEWGRVVWVEKREWEGDR